MKFEIFSKTKTEKTPVLASQTIEGIDHIETPTGAPSKLSLEEQKFTRTPEFKSKYGDWENGKSFILIDKETGEPQVFFHGTDTYFEKFDMKYFGKSDQGAWGEGIYFSSGEKRAEFYTTFRKNNNQRWLKRAFLIMKKPRFFSEQEVKEKYPLDCFQPHEKLKEKIRRIVKGQDGFIVDEGMDEHEYVVFDPKQIIMLKPKEL